MQRKQPYLAVSWKKLLWLFPVAVFLLWQRQFLWQATVQLFLGMLVALTALPIVRKLEKKLSPNLSASLAMAALSAMMIGALVLLLPPLIAQGKQIAEMLPGLYTQASHGIQSLQDWLSNNGFNVDENMRNSLLTSGQELLSSMAMGVVGWFQGIMSGLSKWMLAPVFAFYFLRDRRRIGEWLMMLLPAGKRKITVKILREMKRETASYLRGQLMISGVVGGLTALGLLLCGVPAWLLLGVVMGVLELIPYIGPFLGGVLVFLFSWQNGLSRLLWAMGIVLLVQQLEGGMLSPQLMSDATRLHPIAVLLCVMIGGAAAGITGILVSMPLVLCVRAALRMISLSQNDRLFQQAR